MRRHPPVPSTADLAILDPDGSFRTRLADDRHRLAGAGPDELKVIHRLAGAAATFGYAELGALAIALDDALAELRPLPADALLRLRDALDHAVAKSA